MNNFDYAVIAKSCKNRSGLSKEFESTESRLRQINPVMMISIMANVGFVRA